MWSDQGSPIMKKMQHPETYQILYNNSYNIDRAKSYGQKAQILNRPILNRQYWIGDTESSPTRFFKWDEMSFLSWQIDILGRLGVTRVPPLESVSEDTESFPTPNFALVFPKISMIFKNLFLIVVGWIFLFFCYNLS